MKASHRLNVAALLLGAVLIYFVLVGGSDAGQWITALRASGALISGAFIAWSIAWSSRFRDRSDKLVIVSLLFFLASCALSQFPRVSFDAATTAVALVAAFLVAREVLSSQSARDLAITALGLCGIVLAVSFFVLWGAVWIRWISIPGAGAPPLDLILPVGPYRHYHVVGMMVAVMLPAVIAMGERRGVIRAVASLGSLAAVAVIVMSGSRTVWLATVAGLALPVIVGRAGLFRRIPVAAYAAVGAISLLLFVSGVANPILNRLAGTSTIALRSEIWGATMDRWLAHPLAGSGPGTFSISLTLSDYFAHFPDVGRHADNAVIQLLAEGGLLGIISLGLLLAGVIVGLRSTSSLPRAPIAGILIFAFSSFTDNPSDTSSLVAIALAWTALATARGGEAAEAVAKARFRGVVRGASFGAGVLVAASVSLTILASWAFDQARALGLQNDGAGVIRQLSQAIRLDPSFALYWRDRGIWSESLGYRTAGVRDLLEAHRLNRADATTARALALISSAAADGQTATRWAELAVHLRGTHPENRLTLAYVADHAGNGNVASAALIAVLRRDPWIAAAPEWSRLFPTNEGLVALIEQAQATSEAVDDSRLQLADAWLAAEVGLPPEPHLAPDAAAASGVIDCRFADAIDAIRAMSAVEATGSDALQARVLVATATEDPDRKNVIRLAALRWPLLGILATGEVSGASPFSDPTVDITFYRRWPLPAPDVGPTFPTAASGLSVWLRDPAAAAHRGAPGSGIDRCNN